MEKFKKSPSCLFSSFEEESKKSPYTMEELDQILIYLDRQNSKGIHEVYVDVSDNTRNQIDLEKNEFKISD